MGKYILLFLLFVFGKTNAQYIKQEYPVNLQYVFNQDLNMRISIAQNIDFEGAKSIFFEMPSFSFTVFRNPRNKSELVYSLNPFLWGFTYLISSDRYKDTGGGLPIFLLLLEGIPNFKIEIVLYHRLNLVFGTDLDYIIANQSIGTRAGFAAGFKYNIDQLSMKILYNWESIDFISFYEPYSHNGPRIELAYSFEKNSIFKNIYHCGH